MPPIMLAVGGFLATAGAAAIAIGVTGGVAFTVGAVAVTWAGLAVATGMAITAVGAFMALKQAAKLGSQANPGSQVQLKLDPQAPVPICYGRTATAGYLVYRESYGSKRDHLSQIIVLSAGGPIQEFEKFIASDYDVLFDADPTDAPATATGIASDYSSKLYKNKMHMRYRAGLRPDTQTPSEYSGFPLPKSPGKLSGLAHAVWTNVYDQTAFPNNLPKPLWVIKGVRCYDPRKDSTYPGGSGPHRVNNPDTFEWTENPAICALDWALGRWENGKKVYGIGAPWNELDVAAFITAANVADMNEFTCGGVVETTDDRFSVLASLLQAAGAVPLVLGALISCTSDTLKTSVFNLTPAHVIGDVETQTTNTWRSRINAVTPKYREPSQNWQVIPGEKITDAGYVATDQGEAKSTELDLPIVQDARQAHILAAYHLVNSREMLTVSLLGKPELLNLTPGDCITATIPESGLNGQKFQVVSSEFDPTTLTVQIALKSETDAKHDFALGRTNVAPPTPGLTGTYDGSNPYGPGDGDYPDWAVTDNQVTANGITQPAIVITGECDDPNAAAVIVDYRLEAEAEWTNWTTASTTTTKFAITGVQGGQPYKAQVRYRSILGVLTDPLELSCIPATLKISSESIDFWEELGANSVAEWGHFVTDTANSVADALETVQNAVAGMSNVTSLIEDVDLLGQTLIENKLQDIRAKSEFEALTYINGQPVVNAVTFHANELRETANSLTATIEELHLLGAKNANGTAFILDLDSARVSPTETMAERYTAINARFTASNSYTQAQVLSLSNAIATANSATAATITQTKAELNANIAAAQTTITNAYVSADTAIANELHLLGAKNGANTAFVLNGTTTYVDATTSLATMRTGLQAATATANARVDSEIIARANADTALGQRVDVVQANLNGANAVVSSLTQTVANNNSALGSRIDVVQANLNGANAVVTNINQARIDGDNSLAQSISSVSTTAGNAQNTASAALTAANTAGTGWGVTLNTDGYVTGLRLNNQGQSKSNLTIMVDSLVLAAPGMSPRQMLLWSGGILKLQSIEVDTIKADVIVTNHLKGQSVTSTNSGYVASELGMGGGFRNLAQLGITVPSDEPNTVVEMMFNCTALFPQSASIINIQLWINGSGPIAETIIRDDGERRTNVALSFSHTPGPGGHTYTVVQSSGSFNPGRLYMKLTGFKR